MKKRILLFGALIIGLAVFMTGCGKKEEVKPTEELHSGTSSETQKDISTEEDITITFGFWGDNEEAKMKMDLAEAYMDLHPNVNIEFEYADGNSYLTKMQTWFSSGTVPDVFGLASDTFTQFRDSDLFEDLKPYVEADGLGETWNPDILESVYTYEEKLYAVPFISKVFAIAYNKDLFDAAGLEYPTEDWTEEDMLSYAQALTNDSGSDKVYGMRWGVRPPEFYRNLYGNPIYNINTGEMNAKDNEEFKHAVSLFSDTIKAGLSPDETSAQISTGGFETGMFGMQLCATWDIATFQSMIGDAFEWDIAVLPYNEKFNTPMLSTYRGNGWCMSSTAKHKEASWDFIKFMSANEDSQKKAQNFGIPELTSYAMSEDYLGDYGGGTAYNKQVFVDMLNNTTDFVNLGDFAEVNDIIKSQYELLLADMTTIDELIETVQEQGEAILGSK